MASFEIFQDTNSRYRFRFRADNGDVVAESLPYPSRAGCLRAIDLMRWDASQAIVRDVAGSPWVESPNA